MSNENTKALAVMPRAIIPTTLDEVRTLSSQLAKSSLLPDALRGKEADVLFSIMAGQEIGLAPMASIRGIHCVKGKPVLSADTMVGVVLGSGIAEYFSCIESSNTTATYETKRRGAPQPQRCTWTIEDAKRAGLNGDNWSKHPRAMLKARCKAMLARDVYPDVLAGCYDDDEAREFSDKPVGASRQADVIDVEFTSTPADKPTRAEVDAQFPQHAVLDKIDAAPTFEALQALVPQLSKLDGEFKKEARARYQARTRWLEEQTIAASEAQPNEEPAA